MPISSGPHEQSPFAVLQRAFTLLTSDPHPLAIHGSEVGHGLPDRLIGLGELRSRLLHPSCRYATRDAAVTLLLHRAQTEGGAWTVGLAGVLLPGQDRGHRSGDAHRPHRRDRHPSGRSPTAGGCVDMASAARR
jgi:hypothetical protein